jgi:predicted metal-dependent phosphoesterase TrpH
MVDEIRKSLADKSDEELLQIWKENDRERWSESAFEAIKLILTKRGINLPSQVEHKAEPGKEEYRFITKDLVMEYKSSCARHHFLRSVQTYGSSMGT